MPLVERKYPSGREDQRKWPTEEMQMSRIVRGCKWKLPTSLCEIVFESASLPMDNNETVKKMQKKKELAHLQSWPSTPAHDALTSSEPFRANWATTAVMLEYIPGSSFKCLATSGDSNSCARVREADTCSSVVPELRAWSNACKILLSNEIRATVVVKEGFNKLTQLHKRLPCDWTMAS